MTLTCSLNYEYGEVDITLTVDEANQGKNYWLWRKKSDENEFTKVRQFNSVSGSSTSYYITDELVEQGETYYYTYTEAPSDKEDVQKIQIDFEDIFLSDATGKALRIRYNPQVSSFKTTIVEQKIETIGNKFPFFFRNGNIGYKEIPLGGLITYQMDDMMRFDSTFEYFPTETQRTKDSSNFIERTLATEFYLERKYKRKVEEWLNNGEPKVLRTAAEGNFIVRLMNVSLAPMEQLGRRLHSFTATAYEIADFNYEGLQDNGFVFSPPETEEEEEGGEA